MRIEHRTLLVIREFTPLLLPLNMLLMRKRIANSMLLFWNKPHVFINKFDIFIILWKWRTCYDILYSVLRYRDSKKMSLILLSIVYPSILYLLPIHHQWIGNQWFRKLLLILSFNWRKVHPSLPLHFFKNASLLDVTLVHG